MKLCLRQHRTRQKLLNERQLRREQFQARRSWRPAPFSRSQICAPAVLDVIGPRYKEKTLAFLTKIRNKTLSGGQKVFLTFPKTEHVSSAAMLLLLAEVHRARAICGTNAVRAAYPAVRKTEQIFQQIGFLELLEKKTRLDESEFPEDVCSWRHATGTQVDLSIAEDLLIRSSEIFPSDGDSLIYRGVSEAVTNAHQHAHSGIRPDGLPLGEKRWWLLAK